MFGIVRPFAKEFGGSFLRSVLTSALATCIDFAVASALATSALPPATATFAGYVAGGLLAFTLSRGWAFRVGGKAGPQLLRFLGVWLSGAALNAAGVAFLVALLGLRFGLAWVVIRGLVFSVWNYPMLRWFVFPRAASVAHAESPR